MKPPPLTREELVQIQEGHRRNRDVWRLLHDIRRLRGIALRARQYVELVNSKYQYADRIGESLMSELVKEPCIQEDNKQREELREELRKVRGR